MAHVEMHVRCVVDQPLFSSRRLSECLVSPLNDRVLVNQRRQEDEHGPFNSQFILVSGVSSQTALVVFVYCR